MESHGPVDPVLAFLTWLHAYRRSRRCWLMGGPAAVDDLGVGGPRAGVALHLDADVNSDALKQRSGLDPYAALPGRTCDLLPTTVEGTFLVERRRLVQVLSGVRGVAGDVASAAAETSDDLLARVEATGMADEGLLARLATALSAVRWRRRVRRDARFEAHLQRLSWVGVRLGPLEGRFWAVGSRELPDYLLTGIQGEVLGIPSQVLFLSGMVWWRGPGVLWMIAGCTLTPAVAIGDRRVWQDLRRVAADTARALRAMPAFVHYLARSRRARPAPLIAVWGPDAAASGVLYALFAHLAGLAQRADPSQGGRVLDDSYPELLPLLAGEALPEWSCTYRAALASGVAEYPRARVAHLVGADDGKPDALCRRVLQAAEQVWVVLPPGADAAGHLEQVLSALGPEAKSVVLVGEGPEIATVAPARPGVTVRRWRVDLALLRDRYLRGEVSPDEAGRIVRCLANPDADPPPALPAPAAEGAAAHPYPPAAVRAANT